MIVGDEGFELEAFPLFGGVLLYIQKVDYLRAVLRDKPSGVADVVTLVKTVTSATLTVAVLLVVACGHVAAVDEVPAVGVVEVVDFSTGYTADISVIVGIA